MERMAVPAAVCVDALPTERREGSEYARLKSLLTHNLQDLPAASASSLLFSLWPPAEPLASIAALRRDTLPSRIVLDGFSSRCHVRA